MPRCTEQLHTWSRSLYSCTSTFTWILAAAVDRSARLSSRGRMPRGHPQRRRGGCRRAGESLAAVAGFHGLVADPALRVVQHRHRARPVPRLHLRWLAHRTAISSLSTPAVSADRPTSAVCPPLLATTRTSRRTSSLILSPSTSCGRASRSSAAVACTRTSGSPLTTMSSSLRSNDAERNSRLSSRTRRWPSRSSSLVPLHGGPRQD